MQILLFPAGLAAFAPLSSLLPVPREAVEFACSPSRASAEPPMDEALTPAAGSDEALMLAYAAGDARAFETLYTKHKGGLYRYFLRSLHDAGLADELFQDVWSHVIKARGSYKVEAKFSTWLYRMAHNRLIDHYRRAQVVRFVSIEGEEDEPESEIWPASAEPGPEAQVASRQAAAQLRRLVEGLPPAQREAFLLQAEGGLSLEAIAEATGTGRETVKSRLRYAFEKLRAGMKDHL
jgi:RNA polymerase sigma-70 factor (ECF subfamily)